ncbi:hypothetical protein V8E55_010796 [Tylopilus felleus]
MKEKEGVETKVVGVDRRGPERDMTPPQKLSESASQGHVNADQQFLSKSHPSQLTSLAGPSTAPMISPFTSGSQAPPMPYLPPTEPFIPYGAAPQRIIDGAAALFESVEGVILKLVLPANINYKPPMMNSIVAKRGMTQESIEEVIENPSEAKCEYRQVIGMQFKEIMKDRMRSCLLSPNLTGYLSELPENIWSFMKRNMVVFKIPPKALEDPELSDFIDSLMKDVLTKQRSTIKTKITTAINTQMHISHLAKSLASPGYYKRASLQTFNDLVNKSMEDKVAALKSKRHKSTEGDDADSECSADEEEGHDVEKEKAQCYARSLFAPISPLSLFTIPGD